MKVAFRKLHRQLAPILFLPLLASALTGVAYYLGNNWLEIPKVVTDTLMMIHQGEYLGEQLVPIYVLLVGLGLFGMSVTGLTLLKHRSSSVKSQQTQPQIRSFHRLLALILLFPLAISAETGVAYRLGRDWFGMSSEQTEIFLKIHQGSYFGATFSLLYVLILGLGLIALSIAGIRLTPLGGISIGRSQPQQSSAQTKTPLSRISIPQWQPRQSSTQVMSQSDLSNTVARLQRKARLAIALFFVVFVSVVYSLTLIILSKKVQGLGIELNTLQRLHIFDLLIPIAIVGLVFAIVALIVAEKLIQNWQRQKEIQAALKESEAKSYTILKAVPDSMLRLQQDGICISYTPAKGTKSFVLEGDIIGKHVTEFLPPEIAQQLMKSTLSALQSGSTHIYHFSIPLDDQEQYQEARISPIGASEVLVMIRESANLEPAIIKQEDLLHSNNDSVSLVSQQELIQLLELALEDTKKYDKHHVLCYMAVDQQETICNNHGFQASENLLYQVAVKVSSYLPSNGVIAHLDSNELAILLRYYSLEKASALVNELRKGLNDFKFSWQSNEYLISVSIALISIDVNSSDVTSVMSAADAACSIAKQKVTSKAFW